MTISLPETKKGLIPGARWMTWEVLERFKQVNVIVDAVNVRRKAENKPASDLSKVGGQSLGRDFFPSEPE